jgi:hypothetical protein
VGAGNAALTAALAAREAGAQVLVNNSYQTVRWMQSLGMGFELDQTAVRQGGRIYLPAGAVIQFWSGGPGLTHRLFRAIEPAKTNWALRLDKPPFAAYAVRCGITFTYGGVMVNEAGEVMHREVENSRLDSMWRYRSLPLSWWLSPIADTAAHTSRLQSGAMHRDEPRLSTLRSSLLQG